MLQNGYHKNLLTCNLEGQGICKKPSQTCQMTNVRTIGFDVARRCPLSTVPLRRWATSCPLSFLQIPLSALKSADNQIQPKMLARNWKKGEGRTWIGSRCGRREEGPRCGKVGEEKGEISMNKKIGNRKKRNIQLWEGCRRKKECWISHTSGKFNLIVGKYIYTSNWSPLPT